MSDDNNSVQPQPSPARIRLLQDPQHGQIELYPYQMELLRTPHFQRLHNLKQLGCAYHVYPGASHTRAEHSLGVAWLARLLIARIRTHQPDVEIDARDEMLIVLAAQAHDLGHGAGSHAYEGWLHSLGADYLLAWTHEKQSVRILRDAVDKGLLPCLANDADGVERIEAFILGKQPARVRSTALPRNKRWMLDIVNNARNGIDVDKLDYLGRDAHHALGGIENGLLNVGRILENVRVSDDRQRLTFHVKMIDALYEVFHRRWMMFRAVYLHNTTVAIELMLRQAMNHLMRARHFTLLRTIVVSNSIDDYLLLDDSLMATALSTQRMLTEQQRKEDVELQRACEVIRAIGARSIYRCVARKTVPTSAWTKICAIGRGACCVTDTRRWLPPDYQADAENFLVHVCCFHYGARERNPLEHVYFFDWDDPKTCAKVQTREYTRMLPRHWSEVVVRVFARRECTAQQRADIERAFVSVLDSKVAALDVAAAINDVGSSASVRRAKRDRAEQQSAGERERDREAKRCRK